MFSTGMRRKWSLLINQVEQYERAVTFTLGKLTAVKEPGWRVCVPILQSAVNVDMRVRAVEIGKQHVMTSDNVSVHVDALAFAGVADASKAVCSIDEPWYALEELTQATIRDQLSRSKLEDILHKRADFSHVIEQTVTARAEAWGLRVDSVRLKNIRVDEGMVRALAKAAEASRDRDARLIIADAELMSASKLLQAARTLEGSEAALRLRELQTYVQMAQEKNMVIVMPSNLGSKILP